jgi:hypothetical protein
MTAPPVSRVRDGRGWCIGSDAEVVWINEATFVGKTITAAIPPIFAAYCTIELPKNWEEEQNRHDGAVIAVLRESTKEQPWWLGYLDTGADDVVFPDAPMVTVYTGWRYVLVQAGPEQAASWRRSSPATFWKGALPQLIFPADRSWLLSTLWDDDWTCVGGSAALVDSFLRHPDLKSRARRVAPGQDATPPGHIAR